VLINGMREQLDNARFADNLISYISSSRTGVFFDESHRTYFDPVTVTTVFTGSVSNNWKGFILFAATFVTLWAVTDFVDRAFAWIAGSFRRAWSYISRRLGIGHREEPARPEVDIDALTQEVRGAHPEWREGVIRHVLKERRRHGRFLERSRERSG
jgi:hypothetical protein